MLILLCLYTLKPLGCKDFSPTYQKEVAVALWKKNVHIFMTSLLRFLIIRLQKQRSKQINTITVK